VSRDHRSHRYPQSGSFDKDYAAVQPEPTVTLFDPNARAREAANNAAMLAATVTAEAQNAMATQVAFERANAEATAAADRINTQGTQGAVVLTQQVEQFNAAATQQANSAQRTATAGAIALQNAQADVTATARAGGMLDAQATQEAARANELRIEAQETERRASQADLDRQTWYVVKLALGLAALALGVMAGWQGVRLLSVYVAIKARRMMINERAGLVLDHHADEWRQLPGTPVFELPAAAQPDEDRLHNAIKRRDDFDEAVARDQERRIRLAWRNAAWAFLQWGEYVPRGQKEPLGYSFRQMQRRAGLKRDEWDTLTAWLASIGLLVKAGGADNAPWRRRLTDDGSREMTAREIMKLRVWLTSFDYPNGSIPGVLPPPNPQARAHTDTPPHTTAHQSGTPAQPESPPRTGWNLSLDYGPDDLLDDGDVVEAG
jgi:hypothetical protein